MNAINQVISVFENSEWRSFEDLTQHCSLPECQIKTVLNFLNQYDFLETNPSDGTFRLIPKLVALLRLDE